MRTVRMFLTIAGLAATCGLAVAQGGMGPMRPMPQGRGPMMQGRGAMMQQPSPEMMRRQLFRGITLTDAQKTQLKSVRERFATQMEPIRTARHSDMRALRAAIADRDTTTRRATRQRLLAAADRAEALRAQMFKDVRATLTAAQKEQFDENSARLRRMMRQRMMNARRMGGRGRGPG